MVMRFWESFAALMVKKARTDESENLRRNIVRLINIKKTFSFNYETKNYIVIVSKYWKSEIDKSKDSFCIHCGYPISDVSPKEANCNHVKYPEGCKQCLTREENLERYKKTG